MDKVEARALAEAVLAELRSESYDSLGERLLGNRQWREIVGDSGVTYQVQIQAFGDSKKNPENLRVHVSVDDGQRRALVQLETADFIVAPDGSFVGES